MGTDRIHKLVQETRFMLDEELHQFNCMPCVADSQKSTQNHVCGPIFNMMTLVNFGHGLCNVSHSRELDWIMKLTVRSSLCLLPGCVLQISVEGRS